MADIDIPFTNQGVSTDDPVEGGVSLGLASLSFMLLFVAVTVATVLFNRVRQAFSVDQPSVPGV